MRPPACCPPKPSSRAGSQATPATPTARVGGPLDGLGKGVRARASARSSMCTAADCRCGPGQRRPPGCGKWWRRRKVVRGRWEGEGARNMSRHPATSPMSAAFRGGSSAFAFASATATAANAFGTARRPIGGRSAVLVFFALRPEGRGGPAARISRSRWGTAALCPARTAAWRSVHKGAASGEKVGLPPAVRGRPMRGAPAASPCSRPAPAATAAGVATAGAATGASHGGGHSVRKRETAPPLSRPAQWMEWRTSRAGWRPSKTRRPLPPRPRRRVKRGRRGGARHRAAPPAATIAPGPHLQDASQPRLGNEDGLKAQLGRWPLPPRLRAPLLPPRGRPFGPAPSDAPARPVGGAPRKAPQDAWPLGGGSRNGGGFFVQPRRSGPRCGPVPATAEAAAAAAATPTPAAISSFPQTARSRLSAPRLK